MEDSLSDLDISFESLDESASPQLQSNANGSGDLNTPLSPEMVLWFLNYLKLSYNIWYYFTTFAFSTKLVYSYVI